MGRCYGPRLSAPQNPPGVHAIDQLHARLRRNVNVPMHAAGRRQVRSTNVLKLQRSRARLMRDDVCVLPAKARPLRFSVNALMYSWEWSLPPTARKADDSCCVVLTRWGRCTRRLASFLLPLTVHCSGRPRKRRWGGLHANTCERARNPPSQISTGLYVKREGAS